MAKTSNGGFVFTKADLNRVKNGESKMSDKKRRAVSKALVEANTAANMVKKGKA